VGLAGKAVLMWIAMLAAMFANGTLRVLLLQPRLGEEAARQWASLTGVVVIAILSRVFVRLCPEASPRQLLGVGAGWLALTLTFEFLFGHFVSGTSWTDLLADYDLTRGRLWVLVLLTTLLAPWAWGRSRGRRSV